MKWCLLTCLLLTTACGGAISPEEPSPESESLAPSMIAPEHVEKLDESTSTISLKRVQGFRFVIHHAGPWVVLGLAEWDSHDEGTARLLHHDGNTAARAPLTTESDRFDVAGEEVVLHDQGNAVCFGELGAPEILFRADIHDFQDEELTAQLVVDHSPVPLIVAPLRVSGGDCDSATWARPSTAPASVIFEPTDEETINPQDQDEAFALLRSLPLYGSVQDTYAGEIALYNNPTDADPPPLWEDHGPAVASAQLYRDTQSDRELLGVQISTGWGCGEYTDSMWALFEHADSGLELLSTQRHSDLPTAILDVDVDGRLDFLSDDTLVAGTAQGPVTLELPPPFHVCPC